MITLTREHVLAIMPLARPRVDKFIGPLIATASEFEINTPARLGMFLAQLAHESAELRYVKELASGEAYDTGRLAERLGNTPEDDGDGEHYKGRGLIQITGTRNYRACGEALGIDLLAQPELLELPDLACRSAGWFWIKGAGLNLSPAAKEMCGAGCNLNDIADRGDFLAVTYAVNGGSNGLADREKYYARAKTALPES